MIHNDILNLIYEISSEKFQRIQSLLSSKYISRINTDPNKREEFTIELLRTLNGEKLDSNNLPRNLINYLDRQFLPKLDEIIDFKSINISDVRLKQLLQNLELKYTSVINNPHITNSTKYEYDVETMMLYNILKSKGMTEFVKLEFGNHTEIISKIKQNAENAIRINLNNANNILNKANSLPPITDLEPIRFGDVVDKIKSRFPAEKQLQLPEPEIVNTIKSPEVIVPAISKSSTMLTPIIEPPQLAPNIEIPNWFDSIDNDKLKLLTGGLVALFGVAISTYAGSKLFKLLYGKYVNRTSAQLKRLYNIDIILGLTIIDLLFDTWKNESIRKQFNNNQRLYLTTLYSKYMTLVPIINNLDSGYKNKLISDIKNGEFVLLFSDMVKDFELRRENINSTVAILLTRPNNSSSQFTKLLT